MKSNTEKIEFIRSIFGSVKVSREGSNVAVKCPACGDRKTKFSINIKNWMCHCWVCGVKSKNLYFILEKYIKKDVAIKFKKDFGIPEDKKLIIEDLVEPVSIPENFHLLASFNCIDPDIRDCISYCKKRGISNDDMWYFRIGSTTSGQFKRRVIIPSFDKFGKVNYFVSRSIDKDGFPKYVNSNAKKTEIIFNEMNIDWSKEITIVEGPFDLMKSNRNSTCILGSKLSEKSTLFRKIIENKTPVLIALDPDMKKESHKIARSLSSFGCKIRIFNNSTSRDVGDMSKNEFIKIMEKSKAWSRESSLRFKISSIQSGSIF